MILYDASDSVWVIFETQQQSQEIFIYLFIYDFYLFLFSASLVPNGNSNQVVVHKFITLLILNCKYTSRGRLI